MFQSVPALLICHTLYTVQELHWEQVHMICKRPPFNTHFWQAIRPAANSAVTSLELIDNTKIVLSMENIVVLHLLSLLNSSAQLVPLRIKCCSCYYVLCALDAHMNNLASHRTCVRVLICAYEGVHPCEMRLSVDRVFRVELIALREEGLWCS